MTITERFTLGGVSNTTLNFYVLDGWKRPLAPGTEDRTAKVLGRAGNIWIDSKLTAREFNIPGYFIADTEADLDSYARTLAAFLMDTDGKPKQLALVFSDEADKTYTVRYNTAIDLNRWISQMRGSFSIPLIADDPYAYEAEETTSTTVTASPSTIPITSTSVIKTPAKICIENTGATPVTGFTLKIYY